MELGLEQADKVRGNQKRTQKLIEKLRNNAEYNGYGNGRRIRPTVRLYGTDVPDREFPNEKSVLHWFLIESQGPGGLNGNEDGELSHPAVTAQYVATYCAANHLKK